MSDKPTSPPIPPNCPYFGVLGGKACFVHAPPDPWSEYLGELEKYAIPDGQSWRLFWRPIIAAVAEVAWREEYERIRHARDCDARVMVNPFLGSPQEQSARDNADAWRAWGKNEWKP